MIKIVKSSNGKRKKAVVPKSSYENFFKNAGWHIASEPEKSVKPNEEVDDSNNEDWDNLDEDIEKPLSEMNRSELVEKAESMGLDISDCTNNKQLREKIKSNLR